MIRGVNQVVLHVGDQRRRSHEAGAEQTGTRWTHPDVRDGIPHSNVFFYADDVEATYRELTAKGVPRA